MGDDLQLAWDAALAGGDEAMRHFAALAELPRELKADGTVVTRADRAVEATVRGVLGAARPADAILGEENGETPGSGGRRWIVDPIDGTVLFVAGDDRWLVLVALEEDGEITTGVAYVPAQGRIWWAVRGQGAFEGRVENGRVSPGRRIRVATDGTSGLAGSRLGVVPLDWGREIVAPLVALTPDLPWPVHPPLLVARGDLDVAVQTGGRLWDFAVTSLIVAEAGGCYRGFDGRRRPGPGPAVFARTEALAEAAREVLNRPA